MIFRTKKNIGFIAFLLLMGGFMGVTAQVTMSSPNMHCVSVDSIGDVTLSWINPANQNNTWENYNVYTSTNYTMGYTALTPDVTNPAVTSYTVNSTSAYSQPIYFYINAQTTNGTAPAIDTLSSIYLSVTNVGSGLALLVWNAPHTPLPPTSTGWYKIYREYPQYVWTLLDSVKSTAPQIIYYDTIYFCTPVTLNYRVEIADSSGCVSVSNRSGQANFKESVGQPPQGVMDTVSVTSANTIDITWSKSKKNQVVGYILFNYYNGVTYFPFDTIYGINNTSYTYTKGNPSDSSLSFGVTLLDSCGHQGALSNPQATLWLKQSPNLCEQTNTLKWNRYENLASNIGLHGVGGYRIYYKVNNGPYQLLATTPTNITTYIDSNLNTREHRYYYVQVYDSAHVDTTASSNIICDSIQAPIKPKNNYLRTATVVFNTSAIDVIGYIDSSSSAGYYEFQRAADTGQYADVITLNAPTHTDSISYKDNTASPSLQSYRYRILTLDSCKRSIDTTNLGQTIYLTAVAQTTVLNTLTWNDYEHWYSNPAYYLIYRSEDGVDYTLLNTVNFSNAGQNVYTDNITGITTGQGAFYYYIRAVENNTGMYSFTDTSYSNIAIAYQDPIVFIPDAFCPNGVNKIFKPVGIFINIQGYDLSIINRWGDLLFESTDPTVGWNGTNKGSGKTVEEGVYIYVLTYTSSKGEYFQRKGAVTLLK